MGTSYPGINIFSHYPNSFKPSSKPTQLQQNTINDVERHHVCARRVVPERKKERVMWDLVVVSLWIACSPDD